MALIALAVNSALECNIQKAGLSIQRLSLNLMSLLPPYLPWSSACIHACLTRYLIKKSTCLRVVMAWMSQIEAFRHLYADCVAVVRQRKGIGLQDAPCMFSAQCWSPTAILCRRCIGPCLETFCCFAVQLVDENMCGLLLSCFLFS